MLSIFLCINIPKNFNNFDVFGENNNIKEFLLNIINFYNKNITFKKCEKLEKDVIDFDFLKSKNKKYYRY